MPTQRDAITLSRALLPAIKRKLSWHFRQLAALPGHLINYYLGTPYYDYVLARKTTVSEGAIPHSSHAAIFLIFPRNGLKPSHFRTLRYLAAKGYAPLVVTNVPLNEEDRASILKQCWKLIQRPNYGYDFGGYRDGILSLHAHMDNPDRVILINDSCWFPLRAGSDWIEDVTALGVDFAGAVSNYGVAHCEDYRDSSWQYDTSHPDFHYCSFALSISRDLFQNNEFQRFWKTFKLTNDKFLVVRRGEVALTQLVLRLGVSHAATLDARPLEIQLMGCSIERIREITEGLIIPESPRWRDIRRTVMESFDGSQEWRADAIRFILAASAETGIGYALSEFTTRELCFPFLKKSPLWLDEEGRESTLRILRRLGSEGDDLVEEALELASSGKRMA